MNLAQDVPTALAVAFGSVLALQILFTLISGAAHE